MKTLSFYAFNDGSVGRSLGTFFVEWEKVFGNNELVTHLVNGSERPNNSGLPQKTKKHQKWTHSQKSCRASNYSVNKLSRVYNFRALVGQPIFRSAAWHCPDVSCPLHIWSLCIHISIVLKSISQPRCHPFGMEKLDGIYLFVFRLNSIISVIMWYINVKSFVWLNELLNSMQSVVSTSYCGKSAGIW